MAAPIPCVCPPGVRLCNLQAANGYTEHLLTGNPKLPNLRQGKERRGRECLSLVSPLPSPKHTQLLRDLEIHQVNTMEANQAGREGACILGANSQAQMNVSHPTASHPLKLLCVACAYS